jgi:hypothetical protein
MRHIVGLVLAAGLVFATSDAAHAQVRLAPEVSLADDVDFGVGGRAFFPIPSLHRNMEIAGFFTVYFPGSNQSYWELGGTWYYLFRLPDNASLIPKIGAGMTAGWFSSDPPGGSSSSRNDVGLHLVGGLEFPQGRFQPYVEGGVGIGDIPDFFLRGGVSFALGSGGS